MGLVLSSLRASTFPNVITRFLVITLIKGGCRRLPSPSKVKKINTPFDLQDNRDTLSSCAETLSLEGMDCMESIVKDYVHADGGERREEVVAHILSQGFRPRSLCDPILLFALKI